VDCVFAHLDPQRCKRRSTVGGLDPSRFPEVKVKVKVWTLAIAPLT